MNYSRLSFLKQYNWTEVLANGRRHVKPEAEIGVKPSKVQELLEVPEAYRKKSFFLESSLANSLTLDF